MDRSWLKISRIPTTGLELKEELFFGNKCLKKCFTDKDATMFYDAQTSSSDKVCQIVVPFFPGSMDNV